MITDDKKKLLALHRLQQATESLEEARYLLDGGKSLLGIQKAVFSIPKRKGSGASSLRSK
jgi:hypothetical protein